MLKRYLFYDKYDDTETEVVCENIDTALLLLCRNYDVLFGLFKLCRLCSAELFEFGKDTDIVSAGEIEVFQIVT